MVSSCAPEGMATPDPLVAPVLILSRRRRQKVVIDVSHNRFSNRFVVTTVGKHSLLFVKFRIGQPNYDLDVD